MSEQPRERTRIPQRGTTGYFVQIAEDGSPTLIAVTYRFTPEPGWYDLSLPWPESGPLQPNEWFDPENIVTIINPGPGGSMIR